IGTEAEHEDLTGKDFDQKWAIQRNTDKAVHLQVTVKNAGDQKASLNIDPEGNVTVQHVGNLSVETGGDADVSVTGNATVNVGGKTNVVSEGDATVKAPNVTIDSPQTTCTGDLEVQGNVTATGDVTAGTISLKQHTHTGNLGSPTSPPIP